MKMDDYAGILSQQFQIAHDFDRFDSPDEYGHDRFDWVQPY